MTDTTAAEAQALREEAARHDQAAADSFDRCDTDGFLSQWASGLTARQRRMEADLVEAGGVREFLVPIDPATGKTVRAVEFEGRYGWCWAIAESREAPAVFVSQGAKTARGRKGFEFGWVTLPAKVEMVGSNACNVRPCTVMASREVPAGLDARPDN